MANANEEFRQALIRTLLKTRKDRGYSHEAIAAKAGISRQMLGKIESGKANPTMMMMFKITSAMGVTMEEFVSAMKLRRRGD
ncbi:MAG: helix-turn-helix transcriptional regulator [Alphaproteobacteria bacterium]